MSIEQSVSAIVTSYESTRTIGLTLSSLLSQTNPPTERLS